MFLGILMLTSPSSSRYKSCLDLDFHNSLSIGVRASVQNDADMWKEFSSSNYSNFLQNKRCYGLMLNFDFYQPFKHTTDSYVVFYMTLMNLPRSQTSFEHEPTSLNHFMEPLVSELKEFWNPGVRLFTAESPKFKLLINVCGM